MKKNNYIVLLILLVLSVSIIAGSFAYFDAVVNKNGNNNAIIESKNLSINFQDSDKIELKDVLPGATVIKYFSVENTGTDNAYYNISFTDVLNTFNRVEDVKYSIINVDDNEEKISATFPSSNAMALADIVIESGVTHNYKLVISYENVNENQNVDMGSYISGVIQISEGHRNYNISGVAYDNNGNLLTSGYVEIHSDVIKTNIESDGSFSFQNVPVGNHEIIFFDKDDNEILSKKFVLKSTNNVDSSISNNKINGSVADDLNIIFDLKTDNIDMHIMGNEYDLQVVTKGCSVSKSNYRMFSGRPSEVINIENVKDTLIFNGVTCTNNQVPSYENHQLIIANPTSDTVCTVDYGFQNYTIGSQVTFGGDTFNVLKDTDEYVYLLAKYNLNGSYRQDSNSNKIVKVFEFGQVSIAANRDYELINTANTAGYYVNQYTNYIKGNLGVSDDSLIKGTIPTYSQLTAVGCSKTNNSCPSWINSNYYFWTRTSSSYYSNGNAFWSFYYNFLNDMKLYYSTDSNYPGVRPLLIVHKSLL